MRFDIDGGDRILRALLDRDGDDIAALLRVELRVRADDPEIGIAVLQIKAANEFEIRRDLVGIIDVGRLEERHEIHLRRLHQIAQLAGGKDFVADEIDGLDAGLFALVDGEDDIDPAVGQIDGPRRSPWRRRGRSGDRRP